MKQLTIEAFKAMLDNALKQIKAREEEFSKLDAVIGDGDHGTAIVAAMTARIKALSLERSSSKCLVIWVWT